MGVLFTGDWEFFHCSSWELENPEVLFTVVAEGSLRSSREFFFTGVAESTFYWSSRDNILLEQLGVGES